MHRRGKPYRDKITEYWVAVWYLGGKRYRKRTNYTEKADLEANLEEIIREYHGLNAPEDTNKIGGDRPVMLLNESYEAFLKSRVDKSIHTQNQYRGILGNFVTLLGENKLLAAITKEDVERFLVLHEEHGASAATVATDLRVIKTFANYLVKGKVLSEPFTLGVKLRRKPARTRERYIPLEQVKDFLSHCSDDLRPLMLFTILTGLRRKELVNVRWDDVDFKLRELHLVRAKTGMPHTIPLHPIVMEMLESMERISEWVFPILNDTFGPRGSRVKRGDRRSETTTLFAREVKRAALAAGLREDQVDYHGLRKTCSTLQYEFGADERTADDFLGHSQGSKAGISDLYIFSSMKRQRAAVEAVKLDLEGLKLPRKSPQIATNCHKCCGKQS